jgi:hypothetical protein
MKSLAAVALVGAALLGGCGGVSSVPDAGPTYWSDVAPIVNDKCLKCHQEGGVAPIRLDSYAAVKANAGLIALVTGNKTMPPYLMTHDGTCGEYEDAETLTAAQIAKLADWATSEMKEGTAVTLTTPKIPGLEGGLLYQTPNLAPEAQGGQLAEYDEYRCFPADDKLTKDAFITGYEVLPGNAALVHHVLAFIVDPAKVTASGKTNAEVMQALDQTDPNRIGWPCFGLAGDGVEVDSVPVAWAPGQGPTIFPDQLGVRQRKGDKLIIQMHYNLADAKLKGQADTTAVKLRYADTVERRGVFLFWDPLLDSLYSPMPVVLPPAAASTRVSFKAKLQTLGLAGLPYVDLMAVLPHMHGRGHKISLELMGSPNSCLAKVEAWDFNWQKFYFAKGTPTRLTPASELQISCDYDTSKDTSPVVPGWGTRNEMCLAVMMLALPPGI